MKESIFSLTMKDKKNAYKISFCLSALSFDRLISIRTHLLHPDEVSAYECYPAAERQFSFLQGRYAVKKALLYQVNKEIAPNEIKIDYGIFFQPVVNSVFVNNIAVSISHSGDVAVAAAFPEGITAGVDIERIDHSKNWEDLLPLSTSELNIITSIERNKHVILWCSKEALAKALKTGFTADLHIFEISEIIKHKDYYECRFKFFIYFKVYVWFLYDYCFAMALPQSLKADYDLVIRKLSLLQL